MAFPKPTLVLLPLLLATSCVTPKAVVVEEPAKQEAPGEPVPEVAAVPEPDMPVDDPMRLPDMLTMPSESEFRPTLPPGENTGTGAVIARPPTDPPPRPKSD